MRNVVPLVALSLLANAALGVALWQRPGTAPVASRSSETASLYTRSNTTIDPAVLNKTWQLVSQSPDDSAMIDFLRRSGFPPEVVRGLVNERVRTRYEPRFRELAAKKSETPYWRSNWYNYDDDVALRAEGRALYREVQSVIQKLLGEEDELPSAFERENRRRRYGDLPSGKVTNLEAINRDYTDISAQVREHAKGVILAEDREKLAFLEKEKRADLADILSPEELAEYDRRNSPSAAEIRGKLKFFDASEDEYNRLYQAQRDFDALYGRDNLSGEQSARRKAALPELTEKLKQALGPERYAEYEIVTDSNYRDTRDLLGSIGVPAGTARELVVLHRATNRQTQAIRNDPSLTVEQRASQLALLQQTATEKVIATIGTKNLPDYQKNYTGGWLKKITEQPKTDSSR